MTAPEFPPLDELEEELYELVPDSPPPRKLQEYELDPDNLRGSVAVVPTAPAILRPTSMRTAAQSRASRRVDVPLKRTEAPTNNRSIVTKMDTSKKFLVIATIVVLMLATVLAIYRMLV
jgi:hypothetical protein